MVSNIQANEVIVERRLDQFGEPQYFPTLIFHQLLDEIINQLESTDTDRDISEVVALRACLDSAIRAFNSNLSKVHEENSALKVELSAISSKLVSVTNRLNNLEQTQWR